MRWFGNNSVQQISNYVENGLGEPARRWDRKNTRFQRPKMAEIYNANMGGVDLCDMMLSTYRIRQKSNKYYIHIIYYCIGISVTNSWLIYRRHMAQQNISKKQQYTLIQFQSLIANSLGLAGKPTTSTSRSRARPSLNSSLDEPARKRRPPAVPLPNDDIRLDRVDHLPQFQEKQGRCRMCKTGYSYIKCSKCEIILCCVKARNCFTSYRTTR